MNRKLYYLILVVIMCNELAVAAQSKENTSILYGIQSKIDSTFLASFLTSDDIYAPIEDQLKNDMLQIKTDNLRYYYHYWMSYLLYYKSITYLKNGDEKKAKEFITSALDELEKIKSKDVEVYALLALEQSYNFQFVPRQEIFVYMGNINSNLEKAIQMGSDNVRANYVNGSYDFYTPQEYGGGKKAERFLLKSIESDDTKHLYAPTWGKADAYGLLIQYYLNKQDSTKAKKYCEEAVLIFPHNLVIQRLKKQIAGMTNDSP